MPDWIVLGVPNSDRPHAFKSEDGKRFDAPRDPAAPPPDVAREIEVDRFPMENEKDAISHFLNLATHGLKAAHPVYRSITCGRLWRPRGTPHYLNAQAMRLRIPQVVSDRSKDNRELHRLSSIMGSLADRYHSARKEDFVAILSVPEKNAVKGSLVEATKDAARLHCCAAAAWDMVDEAYQAFGIELPDKEFRVVSIHDIQEQAPVTPELPSEPTPPAVTVEPEPAAPPKSSPGNSPNRSQRPAGVKT